MSDTPAVVWNALGDLGPGWRWLAPYMHNGDLYHACSLAPAFRRRYGEDIPIHLVVNSPSQRGVADLFRDEFATVTVKPGMPHKREDWEGFVREAGLLEFGPESPLLLFPPLNASAPAWQMLGDEFLRSTGLTWMSYYRGLLRTAEDAEPAFPPRRPERETEAARLLETAGLPPGRTALLFPYAQHWPVPCGRQFAKLATALARAGWSVATSVVGSETPIPGTIPVNISFPLLIDVAEQAGWAIALRSGVADVLSSAACRKTVLYANAMYPLAWGLDALELCHDAEQIVFHPESPDDEGFVRQVMEGRGFAPWRTRRRGLSERTELPLTTASPGRGSHARARIGRSPPWSRDRTSDGSHRCRPGLIRGTGRRCREP